jgi:Cdc6-like AAA superfamily ATPase
VLPETQTLHKPEECTSLRHIFHAILSRSRLKKVRGCWVHITGPSGCGKWTLARLVARNLCYESSALVIELPPRSRDRRDSPYGVYASFLHQVISRKPHLFPSVYNLLSEINRNDTWTKNILKSILSSIFSQAQNVTFLVVIHDFPSWPTEVRAWCLETVEKFRCSSHCSCILVTTSKRPLPGSDSVHIHHFDLTKKHRKYRKIFVQTKTDDLLERYYGSTSAKDSLSRDVRSKIIRSGTLFQGSFDSLNRYLEHMFRTFTLSSAEAIEQNIQGAATTESELMRRYTRSLTRDRC